VKLWITVLVLLAVACAAAIGWQTLSADPGYVLIHVGHTSVETTLVFAAVALLLGWGLLSIAWRLTRWPLAAWSRRARRRGRERIAGGLVALAEGRYQHATRELERASHQSGLRAPALLAAARAAHARGEDERAAKALDEAAEVAAPAALALRARFLLERGRADRALAELKAGRERGPLAPSAQRLLIEAALVAGEHALALDALGELARTQTVPAETYAALEARVLSEVLSAATDAQRLNGTWANLTRAQRRTPEAVAAYARRAAALGEILPAIGEIESALRREWSEQLVRTYGELGAAEIDTRLRRAEGWLSAQPNSAGLLLTLGRLCIQSSLWGKAREYLERGLALAPSAALWEALGDCCTGRGETVDAALCYRNALLSMRGAPTIALDDAMPGPLDTRASVIEERSEHGVPRLRLS
jgi:HemY protein